jgi:hypothetical protein
MKIPSKFKLFSQTWCIRGALPGEIGDDLGQCRPDQLEILLNPNQVEESLRHTLIHEIVHSIEQKQQLELTERQTDLIALGLMDLFLTNPQIKEIFDDSTDRAD